MLYRITETINSYFTHFFCFNILMERENMNIKIKSILEKKVVYSSNKDKYHIRGKFMHIFDKNIIEKEKIYN
ncbi:hypothetical protein BpHYR1_034084 [Brachionus plicatilis]|uniref:Uncharacterized protein n=1 Tax=Brachionus plicatilis TaxID=10195 RepID=A0A3M7QSY0_BRAPC|nr:hypothetical protein BpHYR1_034084 [Brachionus plicatilis]